MIVEGRDRFLVNSSDEIRIIYKCGKNINIDTFESTCNLNYETKTTMKFKPPFFVVRIVELISNDKGKLISRNNHLHMYHIKNIIKIEAPESDVTTQLLQYFDLW